MNLTVYINKVLVFLVVLFFINTNIAWSQLPSGYSSELVINGLFQPMGSVFNADGTKMFMWVKSGKIYVANWDGSNYVLQATPVLDISDEVGDWRDFGFSSICLDPDFDNNGLVYMFYMVDREHLMNFGTPAYDPNDNDYYEASISRVTRYQLNLGSTPLVANPASRMVLLGESPSTGIPLLHESHAGGTILFGTDGTLLVSTGDNASYSTVDTGSVGHTYYAQAISDGILRANENVGAFRSQMINSLCGKVLRLDPATGNGVPSNPFYDEDNPRSAPSRMWAMGLRNPFRMSIKPNSGSTDPNDANPGLLFVVDVGWGSWEDLHIFDKPGLNAGWPLYEGQSIHNGYYNSGTTNPDEGNVLFKDNCTQPSSWIDDSNPENRRYTHNRPEVAWGHHNSNDARVPWFSGSNAVTRKVGDPGSPTTGSPFSGNTGVAGVYVEGIHMGLEYQNKYFFTDYSMNWIQSGTLNDGSQNWFSDISQFAPNDFGLGIVHMMQNPLDGYIYYVNIFNSTIYRLVNNNVLDVTNHSVEDIIMFPNPTSNYLQFNGIKERSEIKIVNIAGQEVMRFESLNGEAHKINLPSGVYLIDIRNNQEKIVKRLIVE